MRRLALLALVLLVVAPAAAWAQSIKMGAVVPSPAATAPVAPRSAPATSSRWSG